MFIRHELYQMFVYHACTYYDSRTEHYSIGGSNGKNSDFVNDDIFQLLFQKMYIGVNLAVLEYLLPVDSYIDSCVIRI